MRARESGARSSATGARSQSNSALIPFIWADSFGQFTSDDQLPLPALRSFFECRVFVSSR
jgi:hypothetical protein